ncbi:chemotaxis protein CheW [Dactylosporangium sucinum]|uniref:CheW-like domain-containing protein n=1 Tax=Dactylosporangium sucinum TaxID=1424081 RepID=A0A917TN50_9ACTN|nr:chemotaxis protein CheW [Dactylosporangium sucinum]GGM29897.1 hypothetical protein GCM10007977_033990 [Dactylosporangium sucinum]
MDRELIFSVGELLCALPLGDVVETIRPLPVQAVADSADALLGVAVIRGQAVPVLDTARLLGVPAPPAERFITTRAAVAFATGPVLGVRDVASGAALPLTPALGAGAARVVTAVGVLDARPLLFVRSDGGVHVAAA